MIINRIALSIFAIFILILLAADLSKHPVRSDKTRIFLFSLYANMLILFVELLSWLVDGLPGTSGRIINLTTNSLLYSLNLVPLSLWCIYFDECIVINELNRNTRRKIYLSLNIISLLLVIVNLFTGILFDINFAGVFERGPGAVISAAMNYLFFFVYLLSIIRYRELITGRIYQIIICVGIFPIIGGYFQTKYYGVVLVWPMMALVCLTAYILIEHEEINRDTVTELLTRPQLENKMKFMISRHQPFSLIMLDMDRFKSINDNFGHKEGDEALRIIANLLKKSIMQNDQAYRYAGDEFVILIDCADPETAIKISERLNMNLYRFNQQSGKKYVLAFSLGHSYFDGKSINNSTFEPNGTKVSKKNHLKNDNHLKNNTDSIINQLLAEADDRMYEHKSVKRSE